MQSDNKKTSDPNTQVTTLEHLVAYGVNSVVSREIMRKPTGTVTIFAFDQGQGLSEHTTPFDALVYVIDGRAQVTISGVEHQLSAGEMIIMPANKPHALRALEKFKMLLVMVKS